VLEMARTGRVAMARGTGAGVPAAVPLSIDVETAFDSGVSFSV
jgi:hypothetical protein